MSYRSLHRLTLWLWLGRSAIVGVLALSLVPLPQIPLTPPQSDKLEHLVANFALTFWYAQLCADTRALAWRALGFVALGGIIEILQGFTAYRSAEWLDFVADGAGVAVGFALGTTSAGRWLQRLS